MLGNAKGSSDCMLAMGHCYCHCHSGSLPAAEQQHWRPDAM
jgi:hypothetical protein